MDLKRLMRDLVLLICGLTCLLMVPSARASVDIGAPSILNLLPGGTIPVTYTYMSPSSTSTNAVVCSGLSTTLYIAGGTFPVSPGTLAVECVNPATVAGVLTTPTMPATGSIMESPVVSAALHATLASQGGMYNTLFMLREWSDGVATQLTVQPFRPVRLIVGNPDSVTFPTSGGTLNVLANDTLAGLPATSTNVDVFLFSTGGLNVSVVSDVLQVTASPPGVYTVQYDICDADPMAIDPWCSMQINATIATTVVAAPDSGSVPFLAGGTVDVIGNDTFDGSVALPMLATVTIQNNGGLTGLTVDGLQRLVVPAASAPGVYTATYQICASGPPGCATSTATFTVMSPVLVAAPETVMLPFAGGSVFAIDNDTIDGSSAMATSVTVTVQNPAGLTGLTIGTLGEIVVPSRANAPGSYPVTYRICAVGAPAVCTTSVATVVVAVPTLATTVDMGNLPFGGGTVAILANDDFDGIAATTANVTVTLTIAAPSVVAVNDTLTLPDTGGALNVIANDSVDGQQASSNNVDVSVTANGGLSGLTVNVAKAIVVPASASGTYRIGYRLCSASVVSSCADATVALTLSATARAMALTDDRLNITIRGGALNVLSNDKLGGADIDPQRVVVSIADNGGIARLSIAASGVMTVPAVSAGAYRVSYRVCQANFTSNCANARVFVNVAQTAAGLPPNNRPPSVPGPAGVIGTIGTTTLLFSPPIPTTTGVIGAPLLLGESRLGYGLTSAGPTFQSYRPDSDPVPFGAEFRYTGSGTLTYRWEVVRPGDPEPSDFDLLPEPALDIADRLRQARFTQIDRGDVYLPPVGRFFLRGPNPALLPRDFDGRYLIILRVEADSSGVGEAINGASPYPIRPLTYLVVPAGGPETVGPDASYGGAQGNYRSRWQAATGVAEFSSLGTIPDAGPALDGGSLRPRPVGQSWPSLAPARIGVLGSLSQADGTFRLQWAEFRDAASFRVVVDAGTEAAPSRFIGIVRAGTMQYDLHPGKVSGSGTLRWRVEAYGYDGKLLARSEWQPLKQ
jgi:hypothetical protein